MISIKLPCNFVEIAHQRGCPPVTSLHICCVTPLKGCFHKKCVSSSAIVFSLPIVNDTDRENISSNKIQMLTKSMNMDILLVSILNQLFTRGPYKQIKLLKK